MKAVSGHPSLYLRGTRYVFRAVIPPEFRHAFGGKSEYKISLRTAELREARLRWVKEEAAYHTELRRAQQQLSNGNGALPYPTHSQGWSLVRGWHWSQWEKEQNLLRQVPNSQYATRADQYREDQNFWLGTGVNRRLDVMAEPIIAHLCEREGFSAPEQRTELYRAMAANIHRSRVDICKRVIARLTGDTNEHPDGCDRRFFEVSADGTFIQSSSSVNPGSQRPKPSRPIGELITMYVQDSTFNRTEKTRASYAQSLSILIAHFGAGREIESISAADINVFAALLLRLPKGGVGKHNDMELTAIVERGEANSLPKISRANARKVLGRVKSFFGYCHDLDLSSRNAASSARIAAAQRSEFSRRPFSVDELKAIFSAALYTGARDDEAGFNKPGPHIIRRSRYWLPLIALYTGMRLNEICQLWTDDVVIMENIATLRVTDNSDRKQRLKNANSSRVIPVPKAIIDLGFLNWVNAQGKDGPRHLFPEISYNDHRANYSDTFSKRFSSFLRALDLHGEGRTFHSFRHNFRDGLRDAGIGEEVVCKLGGWKKSGTQASYGQGPTIQALKTAIDKIEYSNANEKLDLSCLNKG